MRAVRLALSAILLASAITVVSITVPATVAAAPTFTVTGLGTSPGYPESGAAAISQHGQITLTPATAALSTAKERRAVIFVGGISTDVRCDDPHRSDSLISGAPSWLWENGYLKQQAWINQRIEVAGVAYFSYSGKYCDGKSGENGAYPDYLEPDTCGSIDTTYYENLKGLVKRVTDQVPGTRVTLIAWSQGGLIASYLVARLQASDQAFARQRIASVVLLDSFPAGLPLNSLPTALALVNACSPGDPIFEDWRSDGKVAITARDAALWGGSAIEDRVLFYTLGAGKSFGLDVSGNVTHIKGEVLHERFDSEDHFTIWGESQPRKLGIIGCALIRALRCDISETFLAQGGRATTLAQVPAGASRARIVIGWQGGSVEVAITSPTGRHFDPTNLPPGGSREFDSTFDVFTIPSPEPGTWQVDLHGASLPPGGEEVTVLADSQATPAPLTSGPVVFFAETGQYLAGTFLPYWQMRGGLAIYGYPISDEFIEILEDGKPYVVQYFERARFEYHPENQAPNDVLLGQFGRRLHPADPAVGDVSQGRYFPETGHNVTRAMFLAYWEANGGLAQFGYPITEEFTETLEGGQQYTVQYFERARLEWHPENAGTPYEVLLGQFGRRILDGDSAAAIP